MTDGTRASGALTRVNSIDFVCDLDDLTEALRRLEMMLRLHQAERRRLLNNHATHKRDVLDTWEVGNDLLEQATHGLAEVQARMASRRCSIAWMLACADEMAGESAI